MSLNQAAAIYIDDAPSVKDETPERHLLSGTLSLHDLIHAPTNTEQILKGLTSNEISAIEQAIHRVKKRKLEQKIPAPSKKSTLGVNEPTVEVKEGVEWVSFEYSHNRVRRRYTIRTDIDTVSLDAITEDFKAKNCVYPRANLPKEMYRGNRWSYETECNTMGWKLAWLNVDEISGKRGLIQRAVDSYRNSCPNMRSRRVARQEKLVNGTLRKRRQPSCGVTGSVEKDALEQINKFPTTLDAATVKSAHSPKTMVIVTNELQSHIRIKINIETVTLDVIPDEFKRLNCAFPRAMNGNGEGIQFIEERICNELGWKLAWLNQRHLAGKKIMLQRAMDMYRVKFMPALQPRKRSVRTPSITSVGKPSVFEPHSPLTSQGDLTHTNSIPSPPVSIDFPVDLSADFLSLQWPMDDTSTLNDLFNPLAIDPFVTNPAVPDGDLYTKTESDLSLSYYLSI